MEADFRRHYGVDAHELRRIGVRRLWAYVGGLPDDSALIRKLREPYEAQEAAVQKNVEDFRQKFSAATF